ncbi:hypothetical protein CPAR01_14239 [Colletotrichum paranaense]|uniref:Uncharacterized protein n=1 Tax=Colletotrichum paranaense TaxID=1914294 RepID=A0ABQ9S1M6_9PEZI|nr:uncharacterized protein CPAR01_14239 [Colletotrichum paranaense]KAK1522696.1 hypothetical protein CPAR01_14239 [Colletotrichum paranaense]
MNCGEPLRFPNGRTTFFRCLQRTTTTAATSNTPNHPISDWIHAAAEGEDELGQATHHGSLSRPSIRRLRNGCPPQALCPLGA